MTNLNNAFDLITETANLTANLNEKIYDKGYDFSWHIEKGYKDYTKFIIEDQESLTTISVSLKSDFNFNKKADYESPLTDIINELMIIGKVRKSNKNIICCLNNDYVSIHYNDKEYGINRSYVTDTKKEYEENKRLANQIRVWGMHEVRFEYNARYL